MEFSEIMVPEADHWRWSRLPRAVQECVWNVYEGNDPSQALAVADYFFKPEGQSPIQLFSVLYRNGDHVPNFDAMNGAETTMFGEKVRVVSVGRIRIENVDHYSVCIDGPQGEKQ